MQFQFRQVFEIIMVGQAVHIAEVFLDQPGIYAVCHIGPDKDRPFLVIGDAVVEVNQRERIMYHGAFYFVLSEMLNDAVRAEDHESAPFFPVFVPYPRSGRDGAVFAELFIAPDKDEINKCLDEIKRTTSSSIYLQVTGTPQSILLQSIKSGWKPYETGNNIVIGGNSLGRGVTFPQLQTIYYCRVAKNPQADTMWQHARMFGYDRDPGLLRVFMPPKLYKLFSDINRTNNSIISQIENAGNGVDIKVYYPTGLRPTRKNVLDNKVVGMYTGGVNYFPFYPTNKSIDDLDESLKGFADGEYRPSVA